MIGVSSIDSSTINLGEGPGQSPYRSQTLHADALIFFFLGFGFVLYPWGFLLSSPTVLPTTESYEGKCTRGKPIRLGKSGLHIQYTHTEETNQFGISRFSFPSLLLTHPTGWQ